MAHRLRLRGPWLSGIARYSGQDCPVTIDLRGVQSIVYRPREGALSLETDSIRYELAQVAPETVEAVTDWIVKRGTT